MTTAMLVVNIVLAALVFAVVVGSLAWTITHGHRTGVVHSRPRTARADLSSADERVGGEHSAEHGVLVG